MSPSYLIRDVVVCPGITGSVLRRLPEGLYRVSSTGEVVPVTDLITVVAE